MPASGQLLFLSHKGHISNTFYFQLALFCLLPGKYPIMENSNKPDIQQDKSGTRLELVLLPKSLVDNRKRNEYFNANT